MSFYCESKHMFEQFKPKAEPLNNGKRHRRGSYNGLLNKLTIKGVLEFRASK